MFYHEKYGKRQGTERFRSRKLKGAKAGS